MCWPLEVHLKRYLSFAIKNTLDYNLASIKFDNTVNLRNNVTVITIKCNTIEQPLSGSVIQFLGDL